MKQVYLLQHKYVASWRYIGATQKKYLSTYFENRWWHKQQCCSKLNKSLRCSEKQDWTISQLHDFSEDWQELERLNIVAHDSYNNGLNSTMSGQTESTQRSRTAAAVNGKLTGPVNGRLGTNPVICCETILFDSAAEAGRQTGADPGHVSACCTGKRKSAGGFTWRHA